VKFGFGDPWERAQDDVFDAGLCACSDGDSCSIVAEAGSHPGNENLWDCGHVPLFKARCWRLLGHGSPALEAGSAADSNQFTWFLFRRKRGRVRRGREVSVDFGLLGDDVDVNGR
jgi:hypothetical protein